MLRLTKRGWVILRMCDVYRMAAGTLNSVTADSGSDMLTIITTEPTTVTTLVRMETTSVAMQVEITSIS